MEIKNLIGKATKGIASTAQKLKDKFVQTYDKVNEKIEQHQFILNICADQQVGA